MELGYKMEVLFKYIMSFLKSDWELLDYPIRYRKQEVPRQFKQSTRLKMSEWSAQIINWWSICGNGDTKEEAFESLCNKFNKYKLSGKNLYRPGIKVALEYASVEQVEKHYKVEVDFLRNVLDIDVNGCYTSDESSIFDFILLMNDEEYSKEIFRINEKTLELYNVDISDITSDDGKLVRVYEKISRSRDVIR
jgi:hypothetical protein